MVFLDIESHRHSSSTLHGLAKVTQTVRILLPGVVLCCLIAAAAMYTGTLTPLPPMIVAILVGLGLHRLSPLPSIEPGISWSAKVLLYAGVALLGLRIDMSMVLEAGWILPVIALSALGFTLFAGRIIGHWLGVDKLLAVLMSGAVAICGVSAAAAICCALPRCKDRDGQLAVTIAGVTVLSTVAMIAYPALAHLLGLTATQSGAFIGGSLHNVSQAIGAGYSVSGEAGDIATVVKLIRVSALLPVIIIITLIYGRSESTGNTARSWTTFCPPFLIAFFAFAVVNYFAFMPKTLIQGGVQFSEFFLVTSLVAIGMKTNLRDVSHVGPRPLIAMTLTTLCMAVFVIGLVTLLSAYGYLAAY